MGRIGKMDCIEINSDGVGSCLKANNRKEEEGMQCI
jgi:hypothetical protein